MNRILIPLDGSDFSKWVLARAERLYARPGASVTILSVAAEGRELEYRDLVASARDQLRARGVPCKSIVRVGDPATEIVRELSLGMYDVLAMATHGRTGLGRVVFGSVAVGVLRTSPAPLCLFRPLSRPDGTLSPAENAEPARFARILVPMDGSEIAEGALPLAERLAMAFGSHLLFFSAVPPGDGEADRRMLAVEYLRLRAESFRRRGIKVGVDVRTGEPAAEILRASKDVVADTIAMTTHGRSGLTRAMYGSVAERVLHGADLPILVQNSRLAGKPEIAQEREGRA
jgi:nucleotide-binding universal stress UspA family protein